MKSILLSGEVADAIGSTGRYNLRELGRIQVRGTHRPVDVFEVCDSDNADILLFKIETKASFGIALASFKAGAFTTAATLSEAIVTRNPMDGPARYFVERCTVLASVEMPSWDGIERIDTK